MTKYCMSKLSTNAATDITYVPIKWDQGGCLFFFGIWVFGPLAPEHVSDVHMTIHFYDILSENLPPPCTVLVQMHLLGS